MNDDEIRNVINSGGDRLQQLLGSMQSFNANIKGSPQYLYKKRKMLETFIEQRECIRCGILYPWRTITGRIYSICLIVTKMKRRKTFLPSHQYEQKQAERESLFVQIHISLMPILTNTISRCVIKYLQIWAFSLNGSGIALNTTAAMHLMSLVAYV